MNRLTVWWSAAQRRSWPVHDSDEWSFLEIKVVNGPSVRYLVRHIPGHLRRTLYHVGPGDQVLAHGALAFVRSEKAPPGQIVVKCTALEKVEA